MNGWSTKALGETLMRVEDPDCVYYAVMTERYDSGTGMYDFGAPIRHLWEFLSPTYDVTVFKPPHNFTLKGWKEEQLRRIKEEAQAEIKKEIDKADE